MVSYEHHASKHGADSNGAERGASQGAPRYLRPGQVAAILHVDANTLARWADNGSITAVRTPGGHRRYLASEVRALALNGFWAADGAAAATVPRRRGRTGRRRRRTDREPGLPQVSGQGAATVKVTGTLRPVGPDWAWLACTV